MRIDQIANRGRVKQRFMGGIQLPYHKSVSKPPALIAGGFFTVRTCIANKTIKTVKGDIMAGPIRALPAKQVALTHKLTGLRIVSSRAKEG